MKLDNQIKLKNNQTAKILLANPRGFCAGVDRAIEIVNRALDILGPPIYVRHEVVHNTYVVENLKNRGTIFTDNIAEIPEYSTVIYSAHGVSQAVKEEAKKRHLKVFDATCPLVTKVHFEVIRCSRQNIECILIGHAGHPEVEGTMGQYNNSRAGIYLIENVADVHNLQVKNPNKLAFVTQTTLSVDDSIKIIQALKEKFPNITGPKHEDICYATQNRQNAVKKLAMQADIVVVVGSKNSSNSNRLRELAEGLNCQAYLIDNAEELNINWIQNKNIIGVTAGASAPENLVQEVIGKLQLWTGAEVQELEGQEEKVFFPLPKELREEKI